VGSIPAHGRKLSNPDSKRRKRINAKLFIDRMTVLYSGETQTRDKTNEGDQQAGTC